MANLKKNKKAEIKTRNGKDFSYAYTDLAQVNNYIESIGEKYYQYVDTISNPITGELVDYIFTVRIDKDGNESKPIRGCRIMQDKTTTNGNTAQDYGSGLTYSRRYSLCLVYGLAMEDDDGNRAGGVQAVISNKTQARPAQTAQSTKPTQPTQATKPTQQAQPTQPNPQLATPAQIQYIQGLGYKGDTSKILKSQVNDIITELKK